MSKSTWTGAVSSDWDDADNWTPAGVPRASSDVTVATGAPVASAPIGTVNSITDSSGLSFESAGTNTVTTFLDDTGRLRVDAKPGEGGTILNIGGKLTNNGFLRVGNTTLSSPDTVTAASLDNTGRIYLAGSSANQALLDVTAGSAGFGAAGVLSGIVGLVGDSAIEFATGEITSLAAHAILRLSGNDAFIEDSKAPGSNSALTGLASIGAGAIFGLHNKAAVSTSGSLVNDGTVRLDFVGGDGGSSLTVGGTLINSSSLVIGNPTLSASDKVTAAALDNTGSIYLTGSVANQALLDVTTGVAGFGTAGVLSGNVDLSTYSGGKVNLSRDSAIEFASGQITSLAANAQLQLFGDHAFIEDSAALGSNSALTGLASIGAGATLYLQYGASVSTTGALVNNGSVGLDTSGGTGAVGGSKLTVGGALTNSGSLTIGEYQIGGGTGLPLSEVSTTALTNTGFIGLTGPGPELLDVTSAAGFGTVGTLTGSVELVSSVNTAIEFLRGQISTIGATAELELIGDNAFIEDSTALGSNSALTGLTDVAGSVYLEDGASVSTTGSVTNSGLLNVDNYYGAGGSTLSIGGALTNTGELDINASSSAKAVSVTANSFVNSGAVNLTGNGASLAAALDVAGATTNNGSISIADDTEELAGAVDGAGSFSLSTANLQFDASVSAGQTINETGADALVLKQAQNFAATISGFGTGDTIDATNFHAPPATTFHFLENSGGTGGTLTLHDGSLTASIQMTGHYTNSNFTLAPDSGTGTLVKFVA